MSHREVDAATREKAVALFGQGAVAASRRSTHTLLPDVLDALLRVDGLAHLGVVPNINRSGRFK